MATINGTSGDDNPLTGTLDDDIVNGLGGDDFLIDALGGNDQLFGGDGDDFLFVRRVNVASDDVVQLDGGSGDDWLYVLWTDKVGPTGNLTSTLNGGSGNDVIQVIHDAVGVPTASLNTIIDGGAGNDVIFLQHEGTATLTLGAGQDTVFIGTTAGVYSETETASITITDFQAGDSGDIINLGAALVEFFDDQTGQTNPFQANPNFVRLVTSGSDTVLQIDLEGTDEYETFLIFENTDASDFTAHNFTGVDPAGGANAAINFSGTSGQDLRGGSGFADALSGGGDDDVLFDLLNGDDTLDGGAGDDYLSLTRTDVLNASTVSLSGGDGNDLILLTMLGASDQISATLTGGSGNDEFRLVLNNTLTGFNNVTTDTGTGDDTIYFAASVNGTYTFTLGAGSDTFALNKSDGSSFSVVNVLDSIVITDFETGVDGDVIDMAAFMALNYSGNPLENPFAEGLNYLALVQEGDDTILTVDGFGFITFQNTNVGDFVLGNFGNYDPTGALGEGLNFVGGGEDDVVEGLFANDTISGGDGDDNLSDLKAGNDTLLGGLGNDTLSIDRSSTNAIAETFILDGGEGNDTLKLTTNIDLPFFTATLTGGAGNDTIIVQDFQSSGGHLSTAVIDAGAGDDTVLLTTPYGVTVTLGGGIDTVKFEDEFGGFDNPFNGGPEAVFTDFEAGDGGDIMDLKLLSGFFGPGGFDPNVSNPFDPEFDIFRLEQDGTDARIYLNTGDGNSRYIARFENTDVNDFTSHNFAGLNPGPFATTGNDTLLGTEQADTIAGLAGDDVIDGLGGDDDLDGNAGDDTLNGGGGADNLNGGSGEDMVTYVDDLAGVRVNLGTATREGLAGRRAEDGGGDIDIVANFENATGSAFGDTLFGSETANILNGLAGDDILRGFGGDDFLNGGSGVDTLDGGDGFDVAVYGDASGGITYDADNSAANAGEIVGDTFIDIEVISFSGFRDTVHGSDTANDYFDGADGNDIMNGRGGDDILIGGEGDDRLTGGDGNDQLIAGNGDDDLFGNAGDDTLVVGEGGGRAIGGSGIDTVRFDTDAGVRVNLDTSVRSGIAATSADIAGASLAFSGIEIFEGSSFDDLMIGSSSNNRLTGGAGNDDLRGRGGNDTLVGGAGDDVLNGSAGYDFADYSADTLGIFVDLTLGQVTQYSGGTDTLVAIERIIGTDFTDDYIGAATNDTFFGGGGEDMINGGDGNDSLYGESGNDLIEGGAGVDRLYGGDDGDMLYGGDDTDVIDGGAGGDMIFGENGGDRIFGRDGDDTIEGGAGFDIINGQEGSDTIYGGDDRDILRGQDGFDSLYGGAGNDTLSGGSDGDLLEGGDGDDVIKGGTGDDFMLGQAGDDLLIGGDDIDTAAFAGNQADYTITLLANGRVRVEDTVASRDGTDRLIDIEFIQFADGVLDVEGL